MSYALQSILESVEARHSDDRSADFVALLMQQAHHHLQLNSLRIWQRQSSETVALATLGAAAPIDETLPDIQRVRPGQVLSPPASSTMRPNEKQFLAGSALAEGVLLVLDVTGNQATADHELLIQLADVFADLHRRRLLDRQVAQAQTDRMLNALVAELHSSLNGLVIANTLATDGATLIGCCRIAVARRTGHQWDIVATTGVSSPNARSDAARNIRDWIQKAAASTAATSNPTETTNADQTPLVRPLTSTGTWEGARWTAVFEMTSYDAGNEHQEQHPPDTRGRIEAQIDRLCLHASLALANSDAIETATLAGQIGRGVRWLTRPRAILLLLVFAATIAALVLIPAELRVEVYGRLAPTQRAFVFAPEDGTIGDVLVEDGSKVVADQVLCRLQNEDLEVQLEGIDGELAAATARLAAIQATRSERRTPGDASAALLSVEQAELSEQVRSLSEQAKILRQRMRKLAVTAPFDGEVFGDRLQQLLSGRPVQRGQFLFEVADPDAGWQLDVQIPEADVRHVLLAREQSAEPLTVTFSLETAPETVRTTQLQSLGLSTDVDEQGLLTTLATARVAGTDLQTERPGAGVVARIHCGQCSLGFVWFRKLIEFVQRKL